MAQRPNDIGLYSRWVGILKVVLPLIAVGLLSTVFLVQREDKIEGGLVFTKVDIATLGDGLTISKPRFSGLTTSGDTFTLTAARATPDSSKPTKIEMTDIVADYAYLSGLEVLANAAHGLALMAEQTLTLNGGLSATTSNNYDVTTPGGIIKLRTGEFESSGEVVLVGPSQRLTAGRLTVTPGEDGPGQIFLFDNGVHLTYSPNEQSN